MSKRIGIPLLILSIYVLLDIYIQNKTGIDKGCALFIGSIGLIAALGYITDKNNFQQRHETKIYPETTHKIRPNSAILKLKQIGKAKKPKGSKKELNYKNLKSRCIK
jgi:hypothetical protein